MGDGTPELLAPAGNRRKLDAALAWGADAVYVGAAGWSMRPDHASFDVDGLAEATRIVHDAGRRIHVAANILVFADETERLRTWLRDTADIPFDALIVSDAAALVAAAEIRPRTDLHISTQCGVANADGARFWKKNGASRVILARECTLEHTRRIVEESGVDIEVFVHGAMCVAVSGRCLLSACLAGASGNRGDCKQACRWEWRLVEEKRPGEAVPLWEDGGRTFLMGSSDLCMLPWLPQVVATGAVALKIEGRMKSAAYAGLVTGVYRAALDRLAADPEGWTCDPAWTETLESVSHRPYTPGFAFGYAADQAETMQCANTVRRTHEYFGVVVEGDERRATVDARNPFRVGEHLDWIAPGMRTGRIRVRSITGPEGESREAALPASLCEVDFEGDAPPPNAILRRRRPLDAG